MSKVKRGGGKVSAHTARYRSPSSSPSTAVTVLASSASSSQQHEYTPGIKSMLQELQDLIKKTQEERGNGEQTLININKTHDRMKQETRVSPYFKQKLLNLYTNAIAEAKNELGMLDQAIDKIAEIKREIGGEKQVASTRQQQAAAQSTSRSIEISTIRRTGGAMRRGMLMTVLQQYALEQPVWKGEPGQSPPSLCGSIPAEEKYRCKPNDQVAARVKTEDGEEEQWILAVVVNYNSHYHRYTVDDIDEEAGHNDRKRYPVSKRRVIPLPRWKADPKVNSNALFKVGQKVLALYPQTTCFYPAVVNELPSTVESEYSILFEDTSYPEGYSPPLEVPQRYVLPIKESKRKQ